MFFTWILQCLNLLRHSCFMQVVNGVTVMFMRVWCSAVHLSKLPPMSSLASSQQEYTVQNNGLCWNILSSFFIKLEYWFKEEQDTRLTAALCPCDELYMLAS
uniref:Uncharacterized protein n=1 Tax=Oryza meridionalis TaxID=40149 RepID=A0A0E0FC28_9ORYZ